MQPSKPFKQRQTGITLLEVLLSLTIIAAALGGLNAISDRYADNTQVALAASQERALGEAAKAYIKDNYSAVMAVSTATAPALIEVATLITAGNLPTGFSNTNAYGQSMCALVLQPTASRLQAMVVSEGGTTIDDLSLGSLASMVGGSGGGVYALDAATIRGAIGGWAIPTATFHNLANNVGRKCDGTAGRVQVATGRPVMSLWFENGDTTSAFLARDAVPGRPELNAMNTPIVMNSVQTPGNACATVGAIAQDGAGGIVSCQGGVWKSPGDGKCVATASDLNVLQTDGRCYNGANLPNSPAGAEWVFVEVYRHINPANFYTAQRVVGMTGVAAGRVWQRNQQSGASGAGWGAWVQQADSQVAIGAGGTVTAAGAVTGGRIQTPAATSGLLSQSTYDIAGQRLAAGDSIYSYGKICSQNSSGDCSGAGGTVINGGSISAAGTVTSGAMVSNSNITNLAGSVYNASNTWAFLGYDGGWGANASPQSGVGSAYVNDVYIRSIGKWASQNGAQQAQLYVCPQYCQRWGSAPFISTQSSCNNNVDYAAACSPVGFSMQ